VGLEPTETPREHSFCQFAMRADDVFEVPDAALDPQFEQNPLVLGAPHIRFYAGAPLLTPEGQPLGTLCAIDTVPRHLTEEQREALRILARQVMGQLELRRANRQLKEEREKLEGVLRMANTAGEALYAGNRNEIFVKQDHRLVRVLTADIQYAEARGDYVSIHTTHDQHTVPGTLQELEQKLPVRDFARIHSQYLVRLDRIVSIEADTAQLDPVHHAESSSPPLQVPIGSSYKPALLARLNLV
jgi:DNA-binding LytR/AlgR family response regulator